VVGEVVTADTLYLMQINPDNSSSSTVLSSTTQSETQYPGNIIPDGQGGVLATWSVSPVPGAVLQYPYLAVDVVTGVVGTPYNLPFSPNSEAAAPRIWPKGDTQHNRTTDPGPVSVAAADLSRSDQEPAESHVYAEQRFTNYSVGPLRHRRTSPVTPSSQSQSQCASACPVQDRRG
jgi:hypothetical protein